MLQIRICQIDSVSFIQTVLSDELCKLIIRFVVHFKAVYKSSEVYPMFHIKFPLKKSFSQLLKTCTLLFSSALVTTTSADILYTSDFETTETTISKSSYAPMYDSGNSPEIIAAENGITPRGGSKMMKSYLHRYNSNVTFRTEAVANSHQNFNAMFEKGKDYWLGVSIFIPADWSMDYDATKNGKPYDVDNPYKGGGIILQFHDRGYKDSSWRGGLPFIVSHSSLGFVITNRADGCRGRPECLNNTNIKNKIKTFRKIAPMNRGEWNDFVLHVKWSPNSDGIIQTWVNGKLELDSNGPNYHNEHPANVYPYFKMGLYQSSYGKSDWSKDIIWNTLERTLYHDELRIGGENSSFTEVAPKDSKVPPEDTQIPSTPNNLKASGITQTTINLNWTASTDNVGVKEYEVHYNSKVKTVTGTSTTLTNLTPNVNYAIKVRATDAAENKSEFSAPETAATDAPPPIDSDKDGIPDNTGTDNETPVDNSDSEKTDESSAGSFNPLGLLTIGLLALMRHRRDQV